jgi:hypothetical protein
MNNPKELDIMEMLPIHFASDSSRCKFSFIIEDGKAVLQISNISLDELKESEKTKKITLRLLGSFEGYAEKKDMENSAFWKWFRNFCEFKLEEKISIEIKSYNLHYMTFPEQPNNSFKLINPKVKSVDFGELSHEASDYEPIEIALEFESVIFH